VCDSILTVRSIRFRGGNASFVVGISFAIAAAVDVEAAFLNHHLPGITRHVDAVHLRRTTVIVLQIVLSLGEKFWCDSRLRVLSP
jgi:hypothetical protein